MSSTIETFYQESLLTNSAAKFLLLDTTYIYSSKARVLWAFMKGEDCVRDLDYGDVFGGPPRQLLMRGKRVAVAEEEEEDEESKDKPVFGAKSMVRRRHQDHFFDDIFGGDCLTWRTHPHRSRCSNERNEGADEIKYEVHQSNRYDSIANLKGDFAKIFSKEEPYSTLKTDVKRGSQSCRWMPEQKVTKNEVAVFLIMKVKLISSFFFFFNFYLQVIENLRRVEAEQCLKNASKDAYTNKKTAFSTEFMRWDSKILVENLDDSFEDLFELQELSDDLGKDAPPTKAYEETKAVEAKIRQWSLGKKGNLRSLLSTLQYVLWEGSEWRAIALVDLVEDNQVKRAYQKALLRLHPDKLQQRSDSSHHKFIAEKVFEILQEAWEHFNNIAPLCKEY